MSKVQRFQIGDRVIYPAHGVGEIIAIETENYTGREEEFYAISFPKEKLVIRVPVNSKNSGLRAPITKNEIEKIFSTIHDKPQQGNRMWSKRASEYFAKINSGNILSIAEVIRDLHRNVESHRSLSEREVYDAAINRLASELAVLDEISIEESKEKLISMIRERIAA